MNDPVGLAGTGHPEAGPRGTVPAASVPPDLPGLAARYGLAPVGARPPLGAYLRELWRRRHFATALARSRFVANSTGDRLGMAWNVLRPLTQAAVYGLVFGILFGADRPADWVAFVTCGVFVFGFTSQALTAGARAVTGNGGLVRALRFPRAVLPVSVALQELYAMLPAIGVLAVIVLATGEPVSWTWLLVLPALALQALFNLGGGLLLARLTADVSDVTQLLPFGLRTLFYLSGVFYELDRFPDPYRQIMELNPAHAFIAMIRGAFLEGRAPGLSPWLVAGAWTAVLLVAGLIVFWRAEERYGRD
ncbi:MAG: ABC transporter permease [Streptosporangiales bacterium]|nr:ABC transporter permease [Streptosporangiales bacterium]